MYQPPYVAYPYLDPGQVPAAQVAPDEDVADAERGQKAERLEVHGDEHTMNLPPAIHLNIQQSTFFKGLYELKTFHDVIAAIRDEVSHMEPWESPLRPSKAMTYMYKLFKNRLTVKQMRSMLNDKESPYIPAIGLVYLRFTLPPKQLWEWFEPVIRNTTELFLDKKKSKKSTLGNFAKQLISDPKYFGEYYPVRMPEPIKRDLLSKIEAVGRDVRRATPVSQKDDARRNEGSRSRGARSPDRKRNRSRSRSRSRSRDRYSRRSRSRSRSRGRYSRRSRSRSRDGHRSRSPRNRKRSRSPSRSRSRSRGRYRSRSPKRSKTEEQREPSPTTLAKFSSLSRPQAPKGSGNLSSEQLKDAYGSGSTASFRGSAPSRSDEEFFSVGGRKK